MKPWNVDDEDMEDIISENYFTVEGEVVKRQNMSEFKNQSRTKNAYRWLKIKKFLNQEANRQKYELFEELIKNEGHEAGIDFFFDEKQNWLKKFANYEWPVLTSLNKKDEMFVNTDVNNPEVLEFRHVHLVGHISHHYFGILGNYLTSNVLGLNSAVIGSKRTAIGNPKNSEFQIRLDEKALNHYQITDIDEIKNVIAVFKSVISKKTRRISSRDDGLSEQLVKSVEKEMRKKDEADFINEKIDYERDYNEKLKLELVKTVNILDFAESSNLIKLSQHG